MSLSSNANIFSPSVKITFTLGLLAYSLMELSEYIKSPRLSIFLTYFILFLDFKEFIRDFPVVRK
ncbi:hypothetical protein [Acidiplasma cupricumulans]|uniref:hypothetical protein n=1 Tax=Acidiplasma cupricumulans TaxID=312540 RepID=UPI000AF459B9|nr:hypothetical protein [Acidiplasma cupricumulans]